jgi:hypothetical protein
MLFKMLFKGSYRLEEFVCVTDIYVQKEGGDIKPYACVFMDHSSVHFNRSEHHENKGTSNRVDK